MCAEQYSKSELLHFLLLTIEPANELLDWHRAGRHYIKLHFLHHRHFLYLLITLFPNCVRSILDNEFSLLQLSE